MSMSPTMRFSQTPVMRCGIERGRMPRVGDAQHAVGRLGLQAQGEAQQRGGEAAVHADLLRHELRTRITTDAADHREYWNGYR
jgi:hypothetical protein